MKAFFENVSIFLFPQNCIICGKRNEEWLCENCSNKLIKLEKFNLVKIDGQYLDYLIYFFKYEKIIRKLILNLKFSDKPYLNNIFFKLMTKILSHNKKICRKMSLYDIIISVPMYKIKQKERGYNQTELLAKDFSKKFDISYNKKILIKCKNTKKQSSLSEKERYKNLKNAFLISPKISVEGKNIILIDDIYTTGATMEECAKVLKQAGAKEVLGLVIAVTNLKDNK